MLKTRAGAGASCTLETLYIAFVCLFTLSLVSFSSCNLVPFFIPYVFLCYLLLFLSFLRFFSRLHVIEGD